MATIWDVDVLTWAASQIVHARDAGLRTSRLMAASPHEILTFIGRGVSARDYHRLKAALDRLQSTTVATSLRQMSERRMQRFSRINEWTERADGNGRAEGIDLIVPDWFYRAVLRNQKGGAGETTFALRLGGQTARQSKRITLFDADQQGSALVWLEQRAGTSANSVCSPHKPDPSCASSRGARACAARRPHHHRRLAPCRRLAALCGAPGWSCASSHAVRAVG